MTPRATLVSSLLLGSLVALASACASKGTTMESVPATIVGGPTVPVSAHCSMTTRNTLVPPEAPAKTATPSLIRGGALPPDFTPVRVFFCSTQEQDVPGDGLWRVAVQQAAPAGAVAGLVAAYRATTTTVIDGANSDCTPTSDADPQVAFVDAHGTAIWPAPPRDPKCRHIAPAVTSALEAVPWKVTASRPALHERTAGGCVPAFEDALDLAPPAPARPGPYFSKTPARIAVCVYRKSSGTEGIHGVDGVGTLVRENDLNGPDLTKALAVLDAAPPAEHCSEPSTQFAVLLVQGQRRESYLELDGCRRVGRVVVGKHDDQAGVRQLDAAGVAALAGNGA